jgi:hypothetical protein
MKMSTTLQGHHFATAHNLLEWSRQTLLTYLRCQNVIHHIVLLRMGDIIGVSYIVMCISGLKCFFKVPSQHDAPPPPPWSEGDYVWTLNSWFSFSKNCYAISAILFSDISFVNLTINFFASHVHIFKR